MTRIFSILAPQTNELTMVTYSKQDLLNFNKKGLIPGPGESEVSFSKRVATSMNSKEIIFDYFKNLSPEKISESDKKEAQSLCQSLFDINPDWVPAFYSSKHLFPWQGACTYLFETEDGNLSAIQLRNIFKKKGTLLGIYKIQEILSHEFVHASRAGFKESPFEELFAYQTSTSFFRRTLGPFIQNEREGIFFLLSTFLFLLVNTITIFFDLVLPVYWGAFLIFLPFLFLSLITFRGLKVHRSYQNCLKNLVKLSGNHSTANKIIFRLTAEEIKQFTKQNTLEISQFIKDSISAELRWKVIVWAYLPHLEKEVSHG